MKFTKEELKQLKQKQNQLVLIPKNMHYHCIVCDKQIELDECCSRTLNCPPIHAVAFTTTGNWGSQIWDLSPTVHAVVCDGCFVAKSHRMLMEEVNEETGKSKVIKLRKNLLEWFKWLKESQTDSNNSYFRIVSSYFRNL